jgi:hypothetical protein
MTLQLDLPEHLEQRLREEAQRLGVSADVVTLKLLDEHLPQQAPSTKLLSMFSQWEQEDRLRSEVDQDYDFFEAMDSARTSNRRLFPPELKGISW